MPSSILQPQASQCKAEAKAPPQPTKSEKKAQQDQIAMPVKEKKGRKMTVWWLCPWENAKLPAVPARAAETKIKMTLDCILPLSASRGPRLSAVVSQRPEALAGAQPVHPLQRRRLLGEQPHQLRARHAEGRLSSRGAWTAGYSAGLGREG